MPQAALTANQSSFPNTVINRIAKISVSNPITSVNSIFCFMLKLSFVLNLVYNSYGKESTLGRVK